jgi:YjbR
VKPTTMQALGQFALRLPETEEGIACEGTALESRTMKRKGKAYLFLRAIDLRLKLAASVEEAAALAAKEPARYQVGAGGWTLVKLDGATDRLDVLKRWVEESHSLFGGSKPTSAKPEAATPKTKKKPGKAK